ncbi:tripartite tricarboxylate transporter substrate binding protein [Siccirubricoccus sp. G192]|uniref:Bug family tripartite tricarboxylate transporter substrate binding protein n=1 Tax=Siccirubricoccus sp. G192 TaxID=2849651 RepID=UPI001C2C897E|nr:tripartite tricarboxylate transporter substrate binding protein [Siccirubricoccus sp. G192]MBV1795641.1 tripartite tricarboxylate transporter substrate binding protein [Siccirubricoccus sp. G192]
MRRRNVLALAAGFPAGLSTGLFLARPALAQAPFPARPVRLVVAFPAGGPTDVVARILAERMARELGQPMVVENRGGANGNIAADAVAKSDPDGYTLLYNTSSIAISRALYRSLSYDLLRDLAPVALTAAAPLALVVHPAQPPRDPAGFIAWARGSGGRISYSSGGVGNISHLLSFLVMRHIGAEAVHVPYRGTAAALVDTAAGNVQFTSDTVVTTLPLIREGRVRAIAVSSAERTPLLPEVPSMAESGMMPPGFEVGAWQGILAPARTPPAAIARLNAAVRTALADPEVAARLAAQGARPTGGTPEDYSGYLREEAERWADVVKESGATAE